jgi:hypothetical protein
MQNIEFHSHEQQDEFIFNLFEQKQNGFFLDISCGNPKIGSNTYSLEKYRGWTGFGFDISDVEATHNWSQHRNSKFVQMDATSPHLTNFLIANVPKDTVVDYISLDVDAAGTNLALQTLHRVVASNIKFKAMTFEHECYIHGQTIRDEASNILEGLGFVPLFADVRLWMGGVGDDSAATFEDWWVHPDYFDPKVLEAQDQGLYYFECVEKLKSVLGNQYQGTHNCSRAWPEEYNMYWHEQERQQLTDLFNRMTPRNNNEGI